MKSKIIKMSLIKTVIPVLVLIASIISVIYIIEKNNIDYLIFKSPYLFIYAGLIIIHYVISSFPTPILLSDNRFGKSFWLHRLSLFSGYLLPVKLGLPVKVYLFKCYLNFSYSDVSSAVLFESLIIVGQLLIIGMFLGVEKYVNIQDILNVRIILTAVTLICTAGLGFIVLRRIPLFNRLRNFILKVRQGLLDMIKKPMELATTSIILMLVLVLMVTRIYTLSFLIVDQVTLPGVFRAVVFSSLITIFSMIPGGYGIKEVSLSFFLSLEGMSVESSILVSLLDRVFTMGSSLLFGGLAVLFVSRYEVVKE